MKKFKWKRFWISTIVYFSVITLFFSAIIIYSATRLPMADPENLTEVTSVCTEVDSYRMGGGKYATRVYYTLRLINGGYYQANAKIFQVDRETLEQCVGRGITVFLYDGTLVGVEDAERVYLSVEDSLEWYRGRIKGSAMGFGIFVLLWCLAAAADFLLHFPWGKRKKGLSRATKNKNRALRAEGKNGPPVAASRKKQKNRKKQAQSKRQEELKPPSGEETE